MHFDNPVDNVHFIRAPLPGAHYPVLGPQRGQDAEQVDQGPPEPRTVHPVFRRIRASEPVTSLIHQVSIIRFKLLLTKWNIHLVCTYLQKEN